VDDQYRYYRAQTIIARKVLKELSSIDHESAKHIFAPTALAHVTALYETFKQQSDEKMRAIANAHPDRYQALAETLAKKGIHKVEETLLENLYKRELLTPKLYLNLIEELKKETL